MLGVWQFASPASCFYMEENMAEVVLFRAVVQIQFRVAVLHWTLSGQRESRITRYCFFIYLFLAARASPRCGEWRLFSSCPHCGGFSCCRARALGDGLQ